MAQFLVILDLTIVNVALPSIQVGLGFSSIELQWVVDAYAIAFAGFLMLGGRATDYFGQRRTLVAALFIFAGASLDRGLCRRPPDVDSGARRPRFRWGPDGGGLLGHHHLVVRGRAGPSPGHRAWGAMNGAGGAAGALFGGIITQAFGWRWVLLINPPIAIAAAIIAMFVVADRRASRTASVSTSPVPSP